MSSSIRLIVRFDSSHGFPVDVTPSTSVEDLKKLIATSRGLPTDDVRVIFCGRELQNHMTIKDYEFDRQSIVHVVRGAPTARRRVQRDINLGGVGDHLGSIQEDDQSEGPQSLAGANQPKPQFFVYCKEPCKELKPGKLRVRCADCKQSTLLLEQEPGGWDDVLKPKQIRGRCQNQGCSGSFAEFYFKCGAHPADENENAVALHLVRTNTRQIPCITCEFVSDCAFVFPCAHRHVICLDCFRLYCATKLNDRQFIETREAGYTLACPAGCDNSYIKDAHHFRLLGDDEYKRFHRFATEEFVLQAGGVLCPNTGCGMGLLPDGRERRLQCSNCMHLFCRNCKEPYHQGQCQSSSTIPAAVEGANTFAVDPHRAERARWETEARDVIQRTTKPCPNCKVRIEKNGGCMHMTCTLASCKFEWCWLCGIEWNRNCQGSHWFG